MKNIFPLLAIAGMAVAASSCTKTQTQDRTVTDTYTQTLRVDESHEFALPANPHHAPYQIAVQPAHAGLGGLSKDGSGNDVYQYTPASGYVGTDRVVLIAEKPAGHPGGGNMQGGCQGHNERHGRPAEVKHVVVIDLTIAESSAPVATRAAVR